MASDAESASSLAGETVVIPTQTTTSGAKLDDASEPKDALPPPREPVHVGDILNEKYRIERVIASSGMGIIYLATHLDIEQPVAIKFLLENRKDPNALARFKREARAMGKVRSDHAVRVIDVDELDADTPFIVMEYLEGRDLASLMREIGRLPIAFTCDLLLQACEALAAAHAEDVVHRDLKPSNIFLVPQPDGTAHVKVIDFGIAKLRGELDRGEAVTHTSTLVGSPRYMSPEQVANAGEVDQRSDVWALGVMLQEMLTAQRCFEAQGVGPMLIAIATKPPTPIRDLLPDLPQGIVDLVAQALQKNPNDRTADVFEFADSLARFTPTGPTRLARVGKIANRKEAEPSSQKFTLEVPSTPELTSTASTVVEVPTPRRKKGNTAVLATAAAALLLASMCIAAVLLWSRAPTTKAAAAVPPPPTTVIAPAPTETPKLVVTPAPAPELTEDKPAASAKPRAGMPVVTNTKPKTAAPAPTPAPKPAETKPRDLFDDPK